MPKKRVHVFYTGQVQGVGLRYTARSIASGLGLKGFVRNLRDARVEVVCEGEEAKIKDFLEQIKNEFYVTDIDSSWQEPTGEFTGFTITF